MEADNGDCCTGDGDGEGTGSSSVIDNDDDLRLSIGDGVGEIRSSGEGTGMHFFVDDGASSMIFLLFADIVLVEGNADASGRFRFEQILFTTTLNNFFEIGLDSLSFTTAVERKKIIFCRLCVYLFAICDVCFLIK